MCLCVSIIIIIIIIIIVIIIIITIMSKAITIRIGARHGARETDGRMARGGSETGGHRLTRIRDKNLYTTANKCIAVST